MSDVTLTLSNDEALVLFEFFARFDESDEFVLRNNAEFVAFMQVAGQLEKTLVAPFQANYKEQLLAARTRVAEGFEGVASGVKPPLSGEPDT
jgi:hypothetical protein